MADLSFLTGSSYEASQSLDCNVASSSSSSCDSSLEICDFTSDAALNFLKQMLLEEELDDKVSTYQEEVYLCATVKSFYDVLGQDYTSSSDVSLLLVSDNQETYTGYHDHEKSSIDATSGLIQNDLCCDVPTDKHSVRNDPVSTITVESLLDWQIQKGDEVVSDDQTFTVPLQSFLDRQIQKGAEEAMKFLPKINQLRIDIDEPNLQKVHEQNSLFDKEKRSSHCPKSRKNPNDDNSDLLFGRNNKQIALSTDEPERNEIFDKVLLMLGQKYTEEVTNMREIIQKELRDQSMKPDVKSSKSVIEHSEKHGGYVDIISLLIYCSEAIATNDHKTSMEIITKMKDHASPNGNWSGRLAYYFLHALEARLAGTGSEIYRKIITNQPSFSDSLKAYHLYVATCPYKKAFISFANQSIYNLSKDASEVHIINYGEVHGFQWPSFFERFANWKSTVPKIRMTNIEVPEPGFHPTKRLDSVGRRLAFYAKSFNVPFKYRGIASKWENVKPEDLNIGNDELVIVNCICSTGKISDEAIAGESPRDKLLKTVRSIKPHLFVHGIVNGSYNSPYFAARFKSIVTHYSCLFDMIDTIMPQDNPERVRIERDLLIPNAMNAIACEGSERIIRPETYKQWQRRYLRAGFVQVPLDSMITKNIKNFVREYYHKEFVIEEENGWILMGWKGRILLALSAWKPD